ncbi:MAG: Uma2 family endonuclease [Chloroflexi bacterium]|nr:Uma2 family endonuclease [Chloroflexota bacterium]
MTTTALPVQTATPTRRRFTVEEYCAMAEAGILAADERLELLSGEIFLMAPIGAAHADITDLFDDFFKSSLRGRARVRVQGPLRIDDTTLLYPDLAVLRLRSDYRHRLPGPEDVLLVIEVSDSSIRRDREAKLSRYAAAGIPEVWIANVPDCHVEAFHDPVDGVYQSSRIVPADGRISPRAFPDVVLTVGDFLLG